MSWVAPPKRGHTSSYPAPFQAARSTICRVGRFFVSLLLVSGLVLPQPLTAPVIAAEQSNEFGVFDVWVMVEGVPLAGARVTAAAGSVTIAEETTDMFGNTQLVVEPGTYTVTADTNFGQESEEVEIEADRVEKIIFELEVPDNPKYDISAFVRDVVTGIALADATVEITADEFNSKGTTNVEGLVFLKAIPSGPIDVEVRKEGYSSVAISILLDNNQRVNAQLEPDEASMTLDVKGRIIKGDQQPARAVHVTLEGLNPVTGEVLYERDGFTDTNGIVRFEKLPPLSYQVVFTKFGYLDQAFGFIIEPGDQKRETIQMQAEPVNLRVVLDVDGPYTDRAKALLLAGDTPAKVMVRDAEGFEQEEFVRLDGTAIVASFENLVRGHVEITVPAPSGTIDEVRVDFTPTPQTEVEEILHPGDNSKTIILTPKPGLLTLELWSADDMTITFVRPPPPEGGRRLDLAASDVFDESGNLARDDIRETLAWKKTMDVKITLESPYLVRPIEYDATTDTFPQFLPPLKYVLKAKKDTYKHDTGDGEQKIALGSDDELRTDVRLLKKEGFVAGIIKDYFGLFDLSGGIIIGEFSFDSQTDLEGFTVELRTPTETKTTQTDVKGQFEFRRIPIIDDSLPATVTVRGNQYFENLQKEVTLEPMELVKMFETMTWRDGGVIDIKYKTWRWNECTNTSQVGEYVNSFPPVGASDRFNRPLKDRIDDIAAALSGGGFVAFDPGGDLRLPFLIRAPYGPPGTTESEYKFYYSPIFGEGMIVAPGSYTIDFIHPHFDDDGNFVGLFRDTRTASGGSLVEFFADDPQIVPVAGSPPGVSCGTRTRSHGVPFNSMPVRVSIKDGDTLAPLEGTVTLKWAYQADAEGNYLISDRTIPALGSGGTGLGNLEFFGPPLHYVVEAEAFDEDYLLFSQRVAINEYQTLLGDEFIHAVVYLFKGAKTLEVTVNSSEPPPALLDGATVTVIPKRKAGNLKRKDLSNGEEEETNTEGKARVKRLVPGEYTVTVKKRAYFDKSVDITIPDDPAVGTSASPIPLTVTLEPRPKPTIENLKLVAKRDGSVQWAGTFIRGDQEKAWVRAEISWQDEKDPVDKVDFVVQLKQRSGTGEIKFGFPGQKDNKDDAWCGLRCAVFFTETSFASLPAGSVELSAKAETKEGAMKEIENIKTAVEITEKNPLLSLVIMVGELANPIGSNTVKIDPGALIRLFTDQRLGAILDLSYTKTYPQSGNSQFKKQIIIAKAGINLKGQGRSLQPVDPESRGVVKDVANPSEEVKLLSGSRYGFAGLEGNVTITVDGRADKLSGNGKFEVGGGTEEVHIKQIFEAEGTGDISERRIQEIRKAKKNFSKTYGMSGGKNFETPIAGSGTTVYTDTAGGKLGWSGSRQLPLPGFLKFLEIIGGKLDFIWTFLVDSTLTSNHTFSLLSLPLGVTPIRAIQLLSPFGEPGSVLSAMSNLCLRKGSVGGQLTVLDINVISASGKAEIGFTDTCANFNLRPETFLEKISGKVFGELSYLLNLTLISWSGSVKGEFPFTLYGGTQSEISIEAVNQGGGLVNEYRTLPTERPLTRAEESGDLFTNVSPVSQPAIAGNTLLFTYDNKTDRFPQSVGAYAMEFKPNGALGELTRLSAGPAGSVEGVASGGNTQAIWVEFPKGLAVSHPRDMILALPQAEVYTLAMGKRNATPVRLTTNNQLEVQPHVTSNGRDYLAVWLADRDSNPLSLDNDIVFAKGSGDLWNAARVVLPDARVTSFALAASGDTALLLFSKDADGKLESQDRRELFSLLYNFRTNQWTAPQTVVAGFADGAAVTVSPGGFRAAWVDDRGVISTATFDTSTGAWSRSEIIEEFTVGGSQLHFVGEDLFFREATVHGWSVSRAERGRDGSWQSALFDTNRNHEVFGVNEQGNDLLLVSQAYRTLRVSEIPSIYFARKPRRFTPDIAVFITPKTINRRAMPPIEACVVIGGAKPEDIISVTLEGRDPVETVSTCRLGNREGMRYRWEYFDMPAGEHELVAEGSALIDGTERSFSASERIRFVEPQTDL